MKKYLLVVAGVLVSLFADGQSRPDITNFSLFQQYYNPAMTGSQGSVLKTFYRNQWTGFEDAPKTVFMSGELSLSSLQSQKAQRGNRAGINETGGGSAFGLAMLHDSFGPYSKMQVNLSYGSAIRIAEDLNLRWGGAITYQSDRLNGTKLNIDQNDPRYQGLLGQNNRKSKLDLNVGIALSANNYYLGYALQDATKDGIYRSGDNFFEESYSRKHIVQAGYRARLSDQFGVVVNSIFIHDGLQKETLEGQLKGVFKNMLWAGGGYRNDLAFNLTAGVKLKQLQIGYAYEMPTGDASSIPNNTNEIVLSYQIWPTYGSGRSNKLTMW